MKQIAETLQHEIVRDVLACAYICVQADGSDRTRNYENINKNKPAATLCSLETCRNEHN